MAGNSLGPSIMEAEDSRPLDIMDPLAAEDFQVTLRCSGMLMSVEQSGITLPETNIAPENRPSQKEISIPTIHFQVRAVSFREAIYFVVWGEHSGTIYFCLGLEPH